MRAEPGKPWGKLPTHTVKASMVKFGVGLSQNGYGKNNATPMSRLIR